MATTFSIGVLVSGAVTSSFLSTMSGTQRTLNKLAMATDGLKKKQDDLTRRQEMATRAMARYGDIGGRAVRKIGTELDAVSRQFTRMQKQQSQMTKAAALSQSMKNNRMSLYAQGLETWGLTKALMKPFSVGVMDYSNFEAQLRDIGITGDLDKKQEQQIGNLIRQQARATNQTTDTLLEGVGTLVAAGKAPMEAVKWTQLLGRTATASGADINDLAKMGLAFESLKINGQDALKSAFSKAVYGGKSGRFELKDMAQYLPEMAQGFAAKGIYGQEAIAQIVASLEVGREGAGTEGEAATNMRNWLSSMNRADIARRYQMQGVDYRGSMSDYVASGYSQYEASILIADRFIKSKGADFMKQWQSAGAKGDKEAQQRLMESFGLSSIFTDVQTVNHLLAMRQRWGDYQNIKKGMNSPEAQGSVDRDFGKRNEQLASQGKRILISLKDISLSIGESLVPSLSGLAARIIPVLDKTGLWVKQNQKLITIIAEVMAGALGFRMALVGVKLGLNILFSPLVSMYTGFVRLRSGWVLLRDAIGSGGMLRRIASSAWSLARVLSTGLYKGVMLAARAILFMGRAMLMNPIGLIITGIAVGAYLIYRYWGPVSTWFKARWNDIKTAFSGGIGGVSALILNWSPLGLFYKVFAGVMKWFGVDLPANFTDFGRNIINGLVSGIQNTWEATKKTVSDLGDSVKDWFKEKLGIHSPSRVFMDYGDNIVQGLTIGINRSTPGVGKTVDGLGGSLRPRLPSLPAIPELPTGFGDRMRGGIHIAYTPKIYIDGQAQQPAGAIQEALTLSRQELERMLRDILWQEQRRAY
ncbi:phage tail tape measure protein [Salmonella enterica subsp. enterica serovar Newport]|uniref:phage tail tape measure protein n=1 Tax=Salmonella enterica TaxID=28901 RepID=UPI0009E96D25|nr:phage tail tape measure protein [Salmonella enterica]EBQ5245429.1 phage tail tape measure protein [Salmonella enterica subsp. salamae]EBX1374824.1 phage tail tape measure protein [Salmonella enterica subsp. enterica serovar Newport]ECA5248093.1 phage tail tape measure protein [Salmonella enterica subsp. enterica serovar Lomalinda]ECD3767969.1 phage tail tape measure protein [Salmonella enterica subsp. enterica serovar Onderstepoort]EBH2658051.1 phage tail tape measure protein [Salmonella en